MTSLDAVLAQYEQSKSPDYGQKGMSQEEALSAARADLEADTE